MWEEAMFQATPVFQLCSPQTCSQSLCVAQAGLELIVLLQYHNPPCLVHILFLFLPLLGAVSHNQVVSMSTCHHSLNSAENRLRYASCRLTVSASPWALSLDTTPDQLNQSTFPQDAQGIRERSINLSCNRFS